MTVKVDTRSYTVANGVLEGITRDYQISFSKHPAVSPDNKIQRLVSAYRQRVPGQHLISAHRGLRSDDSATENSLSSLVAAANAGIPSVEIDVRLSADGEVVCVHDAGLGRTTNVAEMMGRKDIYSPITGRGWNPTVNSLNWHGCMERLQLKTGSGKITIFRDYKICAVLQQRKLTLSLDCVRENHLQILIFMDIKDEGAMAAAYEIVKHHADAQGVPALEYCVWKPDVSFVPYPGILEQQAWFKDVGRLHIEIDKLTMSACKSHQQPLYIPVLEPSRPEINMMRCIQEWSSRSYVISIEVGLRSPGGPLQDVVNWMKTNRPDLGMGFFAALGEGPGRIDDRGRRSCFYENCPIAKHDNILLPGEAPDGLDHRAELEKYFSMGFSWVIADILPETAELYANQRDITLRPTL